MHDRWFSFLNSVKTNKKIVTECSGPKEWTVQVLTTSNYSCLYWLWVVWCVFKLEYNLRIVLWTMLMLNLCLSDLELDLEAKKSKKNATKSFQKFPEIVNTLVKTFCCNQNSVFYWVDILVRGKWRFYIAQVL